MSDTTSGSSHLTEPSTEKPGLFTDTVECSTCIDALKRWDPETEESISEIDLELISAHLDDLRVDEWLSILREANLYHADDEAIPASRREFLCSLANGPLDNMTSGDWEILVKFEGFLFHEWSIYPEVRTATRPIDERDEGEYETLRVYVLGIAWACAGCVLDTFFEPRFPAITISGGALQLLIAGSGRMLSIIPRISFRFFGKELIINSGKPWSFKEQTLAMLTMSVALGSPYSQTVVLTFANPHFYNFADAGSFGFTILLTLSTQFLGFGIAGLVRAFNVYPVKMIWYDVLPNIVLNRTLTEKEPRENVNGWRLKRLEWFWLCAWIAFGWFWITNLVFQALSYFSWVSWISPKNVNLQAISGPYTGLGLNPVVNTFDTNVISFSSIYTPLSVINVLVVGYIVSFLAIIIIWYTNVRFTGYLPINSNTLYDNTGEPFQVSKILNDNLQLDEEKYQKYSLPYWSAGNLVNYGSFFMVYTAVVVYMPLNYWSIIREAYAGFWDGIRNSQNPLNRFHDTFSRRQRKYREVPEWCYLLILCVSLAFGIALVEHFTFTQTPVWTIFLALGLSLFFIVPVNALRARTTQTFSINVLYELIIGYALPGNGPAIMVSKAFGTMMSLQADNWNSNQAQAHYVGISPWALLRCQVASVVCASFVQSGIITWMASGALGPSFCTPKDPRKFMCMGERTYFNAAVQWGTIGPRRVFKEVYASMPWAFLLGALFPIPFWMARRYLPRLAEKFPEGSRLNKWLKVTWLFRFNEIVLILACIQWAPSNWYYTLPNWEFGYFWHLLVKPLFPRWAFKYGLSLYNANSVGVAFAGLFNFFATEYHHIVTIDWWGNSVYENTIDATAEAVRLGPQDLLPKGYFGPTKGEFP